MTESSDFVRGVFVGIAGAAVAVHGWLAFQLAIMRNVYAGLAATPGLLTRIVISPIWLWSVPMLGAIAVGVLVTQRPRGRLPYVLVAIVLVGLAITTWHWAQGPIYEPAIQ